MVKFLIAVGLTAASVPLWGAMPPAEQNALVQQYCAVCHTDAASNGGLSLEHYDAARRDPALAAMILSKLKSNAMGAAGKGVPDKAAQQAWLESTTEQAAGADEWFVSRENGLVSASIVRDVPVRLAGASTAPLYRLHLACNPATGIGYVQLTWSPQAQNGRTMTAASDSGTPVEYRIEGKEAMGNGAGVLTGRASVILNQKPQLPEHSLTIRELFPGEIVEFPLAGLKARPELSKCF